jgi:hypothetical protein
MVKKQKRLPVRHEHIELDGDWEGWSFTARVSLGMGEFTELMERISPLRRDTEAKPEEIGAALRYSVEYLRRVVISWDFVDEDGGDLPLDDLESWKKLPIQLVNGMFAGINERITSAPLAEGGDSPPAS